MEAFPRLVWIRNVGTAYHQQDTTYYCGAAVAQMILDQIGAGLLSQTTLYNSNHANNTHSGWATDPNGLATTLRNFRPPGFTNTFSVYKMATEVEGSEKIVYTLWQFGVATGTLVFGCAHWIAVRGVSTSIEPKPGNTYAINGFWINNPWPEVPSYDNPAFGPPPPHSATDGCGSGGIRGIANEYVAYDPDWKDTYFTGCSWCGSFGYISVCDPEPPKLGKLDIRAKPLWSRGELMIKPEQAIEFALKGLDEHALGQDTSFKEALAKTKPQKPILVQRLDRLDSYYYIVPMGTEEGVTAMLRVDGLYGNFRGGKILAKPAKRPFLDAKRQVDELIGKPIELADGTGRLIIRREAYCLNPVMVWRPCKESRSPYYPFYMITVGPHRVYIGYDGSVYSELHDIGPGG